VICDDHILTGYRDKYEDHEYDQRMIKHVAELHCVCEKCTNFETVFWWHLAEIFKIL